MKIETTFNVGDKCYLIIGVYRDRKTCEFCGGSGEITGVNDLKGICHECDGIGTVKDWDKSKFVVHPDPFVIFKVQTLSDIKSTSVFYWLADYYDDQAHEGFLFPTLEAAQAECDRLNGVEK